MIYVSRKSQDSQEFVLIEEKEDDVGKRTHHVLGAARSHEEGVIRMFIEYYEDDPEGFHKAVVEFVIMRGMEDAMSKRAMKVLKEMES